MLDKVLQVLDSGTGAVSGLSLDVFQHVPYTSFAGDAFDMFCRYVKVSVSGKQKCRALEVCDLAV
jgi:hypothetical protein